MKKRSRSMLLITLLLLNILPGLYMKPVLAATTTGKYDFEASFERGDLTEFSSLQGAPTAVSSATDHRKALHGSYGMLCDAGSEYGVISGLTFSDGYISFLVKLPSTMTHNVDYTILSSFRGDPYFTVPLSLDLRNSSNTFSWNFRVYSGGSLTNNFVYNTNFICGEWYEVKIWYGVTTGTAKFWVDGELLKDLSGLTMIYLDTLRVGLTSGTYTAPIYFDYLRMDADNIDPYLLFKYSFESGVLDYGSNIDQWDSNVTEAGCYINVDPVGYDSVYALNVTQIDPADGADTAYLIADLPITVEGIRYMFDYQSFSRSMTTDHQRIGYISYVDPIGNNQKIWALVRVTVVGVDERWNTEYWGGGILTETVPLNRWEHIEFEAVGIGLESYSQTVCNNTDWGSDDSYSMSNGFNRIAAGMYDANWDNHTFYMDNIMVTPFKGIDHSVSEHRTSHPATFTEEVVESIEIDMYTMRHNFTGSWIEVGWNDLTDDPYRVIFSETVTLPATPSGYSKPYQWSFLYNDTSSAKYSTLNKTVHVGMLNSIMEINFEDATPPITTPKISVETTAPGDHEVATNRSRYGSQSIYIYSNTGGAAGRVRFWADYRTSGEAYSAGSDSKKYYIGDTIYTGLWVYIEDTGGYINPMVLYQSSGTQYLEWFIVDENYIDLRHYYPTDVTDRNNTFSLKTGEWYWFVQGAKIDALTGWYGAWIDDTQYIYNSSLDTTGMAPYLFGDMAKFGVVHYEVIGTPAHIYVDDFVLSTTYPSMPICDPGIALYNQTLLNTGGNPYPIRGKNCSVSSLEWFGGNSTLKLTAYNITAGQAWLDMTWPWAMNSTVKLKYDNGTIVNAEDYLVDGNVRATWLPSSNETLLLYYEADIGWTGIVNKVTNPTRMFGILVANIIEINNVP